MDISFIESPDRDDLVVFFPESYKFFKADKIVKEVINSYRNGFSLEDISTQYKLPYSQIEKIILKVNESIIPINKIYFEKRLKDFETTLEKLVINITGKCNMQCKYCYEQMGNFSEQNNHMSYETIDSIFDVLIKKYNVIESIQFFGGEALLNIDAIEYICKKVIILYKENRLLTFPKLGLVSNGTLINENIINILNKYNINITISFDGIPYIHDKVRVFGENKASSSLIINNIKKLASNNISVAVEVTYNKEHDKENIKIVDIIKYLQNELNIKNVHITPVIIKDVNNPLYLDDPSEFINCVNDLFVDNEVDIYPELINRFLISLSNKKTSPFFCSAGVGQLSIASNGDLYPCFMLIGDNNYTMGNIHTDNILEEESFINISNLFKSQFKSENDKCKNCFLINICNSCIGANNIMNKSAFSPSEYFCEINKNMFKKVLFNLSDKYMSIKYK